MNIHTPVAVSLRQEVNVLAVFSLELGFGIEPRPSKAAQALGPGSRTPSNLPEWPPLLPPLPRILDREPPKPQA